MMTILHNPVVHGALVACVTAAMVDVRAWKSWGDVAFNWRTASYRWVTAAAFGALASAGLGSI